MPRLSAPDKRLLLELPAFEGLGLDAVTVPQTTAQLQSSYDALHALPFIGFDTESRPCFTAGQAPRGPDVVQFSTAQHAYVVQMNHAGGRDLARELLKGPAVKVGFGLGQDQSALELLLGVRARPMLDLDVIFHRRGYATNLGVKSAVAILFNKRLLKSKRVTTSNWAIAQLEPRQVLYAANDAYAALRVLQALNLPAHKLPIDHDLVALAAPMNCPSCGKVFETDPNSVFPAKPDPNWSTEGDCEHCLAEVRYEFDEKGRRRLRFVGWSK